MQSYLPKIVHLVIELFKQGLGRPKRCLKTLWGFPVGAVVKNPPANAGDTGSSLGLGRSHMPRSN